MTHLNTDNWSHIKLKHSVLYEFNCRYLIDVLSAKYIHLNQKIIIVLVEGLRLLTARIIRRLLPTGKGGMIV